LKRNALQIVGEGIEYLLVNILLKFIYFKGHKYGKTFFHVFLLEMGLKNYSLEKFK
jgi:hypothetical protein